MKYKVLHTYLSFTTPNDDPFKAISGTYKAGDILSDKDLTDVGYDIDFLLRNEAVEKLEGQDDPVVVKKAVAK